MSSQVFWQLRVAVLLLLPGVASAYVDPGSGMLLLQGLVAAIGALVMLVRHPVDSIKRLWRRWFGK